MKLLQANSQEQHLNIHKQLNPNNKIQTAERNRPTFLHILSLYET